MRSDEFIIETVGFVKGDLVKITPKGIKVFGSSQYLGVGDWVEVKDTGHQHKIVQIKKGLVRLDDGKFYSLQKLRYPFIGESLNEGGWEDVITQRTRLTPSVIKSTLKIVKRFVDDFNDYLRSKGEDPVKMGHPLGSSAYYNVDDPDTEYGDVDMQMIAPHKEGMSSFQLAKHYNALIDEFLSTNKPPYYYDRGKPNNGHPIFKIGDDAYVQVDLLWTTERLSDWDRWRKTPMRGVKGLIMGNLYSTLGEIMNMSLQSAVLMKMKNGEPINFQRGRKPDKVIEVTKDIRNFGLDILKFIYKNVYGSLKGLKVDPELKRYPGLNPDNIQVSDIVHTIKGLAKSFELNDLYGKFNLKDYHNADEFINAFLSHYLEKAEKAKHSSKLDKAQTPEGKAKAQELRDKIDKGVELVKKAFNEE